MTKKTKSGKTIVVDGHWSLVRDERGEPKQFIVLYIDGSKHKKTSHAYFSGTKRG